MKRSFDSMSHEQAWATVHYAANSFEADLVRGLLDEEEIPTLSEADASGALFGKSSGLRILVPREEEPAARELLRAYHGPTLKVINLADYLPARRPARSRRIAERFARFVAIPLFVLLILSLVLVVLRWG
jgi:hypothetical protein